MFKILTRLFFMSLGLFFSSTKKHALVPFMSLIPSKSRPHPFPKPLLQSNYSTGILISIYSIDFPVSRCNTAHVIYMAGCPIMLLVLPISKKWFDKILGERLRSPYGMLHYSNSHNPTCVCAHTHIHIQAPREPLNSRGCWRVCILSQDRT
jgi:hypothetical protein